MRLRIPRVCRTTPTDRLADLSSQRLREVAEGGDQEFGCLDRQHVTRFRDVQTAGSRELIDELVNDRSVVKDPVLRARDDQRWKRQTKPVHFPVRVAHIGQQAVQPSVPRQGLIVWFGYQEFRPVSRLIRFADELSNELVG